VFAPVVRLERGQVEMHGAPVVIVALQPPDGEATQAAANAAHAEKLRLLQAIIEAPTSPDAILNRARLMLWYEGAYDPEGAAILTDLAHYNDDESELVRRLYRDLEPPRVSCHVG
jgi:hypothetical protein